MASPLAIPEVHEVPETDAISHELASSCVCGPTILRFLLGTEVYAFRIVHHPLIP